MWAAASPRNLLGIQILYSHVRPTKSESACNYTPRWFLCTLKFEMHEVASWLGDFDGSTFGKVRLFLMGYQRGEHQRTWGCCLNWTKAANPKLLLGAEKSYLASSGNLDTSGNAQRLSNTGSQGQNACVVDSLAASITTHYQTPKQEKFVVQFKSSHLYYLGKLAF